MKRLFSGKCAAVVLMSACVMAPGGVAASQDGVNVGSYHVDAASAGSGPYTVIFESGFASDLSVWRKVASWSAILTAAI